VETAADAAFLKACGYDYAQGYLYSVALEPDALVTWIRRFNAGALKDQRRNSIGHLSLH
jgi:sensor c-di-GMP phosphodiesterase-like protein